VTHSRTNELDKPDKVEVENEVSLKVMPQKRACSSFYNLARFQVESFILQFNDILVVDSFEESFFGCIHSNIEEPPFLTQQQLA
jgi:hypothetical protein